VSIITIQNILFLCQYILNKFISVMAITPVFSGASWTKISIFQLIFETYLFIYFLPVCVCVCLKPALFMLWKSELQILSAYLIKQGQLKGIVHPPKKIVSSYIHSQVVPNQTVLG